MLFSRLLSVVAPPPPPLPRTYQQEDCYGEDRFNGWTPLKEEGKDANGVDLPGLDDGVWRRPFRAESVIYGRLRGELDPK